MNSGATADYWSCYNALPKEIQFQARQKFELWKKDPFHPSLHFKEIKNNLWSVRVNRQYRALGRRKDSLIVWFWIGPHAEYDELLQRLD
jgi:hypothetical protein